MKKICLVIHSFQPGGTERVMSELATNFSLKREVEVHLVLYGKNREVFYNIPDSVIVHTPDFKFNDNRRSWSSIKTLYFLRNKVNNLNPDVILSLGEYWNSFVMLSLLGSNYSVYLSDRCKPDKNLGKLHEYLRSWLYPKASGLVAQTEIAKEVFSKKKLNDNIEVIGNPIKKIEGISKDRKRENIILTVGRVIESKHHDQLISIYNRLKRDDWKLVIVGGDALKQDGTKILKKIIKKHNLKGRVELTGNVDNVEEYYLNSKIFAFTSSSEGFPNVIGEAMSAGLPVVAYDCVAGPSELVDDLVNGYLIKLFEEDQFLEKLKLLINDDQKRKEMGRKSLELVNKFSSEQISEKYYRFMTHC